jgi:hypothetical protein
MFETSSGNAELIKELAASAPYPVGDSALAALYQAGTQNSDFTVFRQAGFVGLNFALIDGVSAYHHVRDTAANFDPAGLQHMGANMLGLARGLAERDLVALRSEQDAVFFTVFGQMITYPMWLVWPLAGLALAIVLLGAVVMTLLLTGIGLVVDRFDEDHPRQANLMYALDADTRTAIWVSENRTPDPWTARYARTSNGEPEPPRPLPYGITPSWIGPAGAVAMDPPRVDLLGSRSEGDSTEVRVRVASLRGADVITIHADRPVETATVLVDGLPPVTASPSYPDAAGERTWPYELRFYDPHRTDSP